MVKLKNPRPVRLMDGEGRFDLKPGEEVEFESVPKDVMVLIKKGYLKEVVKRPPVKKPRASSHKQDKVKVENSDTASLSIPDKGKTARSQKETATEPKPQAKGK